MHATMTVLHTLAAVIWIGGMFFAFVAVRPALTTLLEPPLRLPVWQRVFSGFFRWVWVAIITLYLSGLWIIFSFYGGMAKTPLYIHIMLGISSLMAMLFAFLYFVPYQRLCQAVGREEFPLAAKNLLIIRRIIETNLTLGIITLIIAASGRFW